MSWKAIPRVAALAGLLFVASCGSAPKATQGPADGDPASEAEPVVPKISYVHDGARYHTSECRRGRNGRPIPLVNAERHFQPCRVCIPPQ